MDEGPTETQTQKEVLKAAGRELKLDQPDNANFSDTMRAMVGKLTLVSAQKLDEFQGLAADQAGEKKENTGHEGVKAGAISRLTERLSYSKDAKSEAVYSQALKNIGNLAGTADVNREENDAETRVLRTDGVNIEKVAREQIKMIAQKRVDGAALNELFSLPPGNSPDARLISSVRALQTRIGSVPVNGVFGPNTLRRANEVLSWQEANPAEPKIFDERQADLIKSMSARIIGP